MSNSFFIYTHTFNDKFVYVGKGKKNRHLKLGRNTFYNNVWNKYGDPTIEIIENNLTEEEAFKKEIELIQRLKQKHQVSLLNLTNGGEGSSGLIHSEETKLKMRKPHRPLSTLTKQRMSMSKSGKNHNMYGKQLDESVTHKISMSLKGRSIPDETRNKISESLKGPKNHFYGQHHTQTTKDMLKRKVSCLLCKQEIGICNIKRHQRIRHELQIL